MTWSHPHSAKNSTPFPVTRTEPYFHRSIEDPSYGNFNAYHLVKIINKLLDIWNRKTDLQIISNIHNIWIITFGEYHQIQMDKNNTLHFLKVKYERSCAQISISFHQFSVLDHMAWSHVKTCRVSKLGMVFSTSLKLLLFILTHQL